MTIDKRILDYWTEWVLEEGWRISRRFMQEIEYELNCERVPVQLLLVSQNLVNKWIQFARRN